MGKASTKKAKRKRITMFRKISECFLCGFFLFFARGNRFSFKTSG
jgi:hypothetical protein